MEDLSRRKIYDAFIILDDFKFKSLKQLGFTRAILDSFVKEGIIKRDGKDAYAFLDSEGLIKYSHELRMKKNYNSYTRCLQKCLMLDSDNKEIARNIFMQMIIDEKIVESFEYYRKAPLVNEYDNNLLLFLYNNILTLPLEYQEKVNVMHIEDMRFESDYYNAKSIAQGHVRSAIYYHQYVSALEKIDELSAAIGKKTALNFVLHNMADAALRQQHRSRKIIRDLINDKYYDDLVEYLEEEHKNRRLSRLEEKVLGVAKDLVYLIDNHELENVNYENTGILDVALANKNYPLAFELNRKDLNRRNLSVEEDILYLILEDMADMIKMMNPNMYSHFKSQLSDKKIEDIFKEVYLPRLEDTGLLLIEDINMEEAKKIKGILVGMREVSAFLLDDEDRKVIVLKSKRKTTKSFKISDTMKRVSDAYDAGNYLECINEARPLIEVSNYDPLVFYKVGMSYYNLDKKPESYNFLKFASLLDKDDKYSIGEIVDNLGEHSSEIITSDTYKKKIKTKKEE